MKKVISIVLASVALFCVIAPAQTAEAQVVVIYGGYCCDGYGIRQCVLENGAYPVGNPCFCEGKGYGLHLIGGWL